RPPRPPRPRVFGGRHRRPARGRLSAAPLECGGLTPLQINVHEKPKKYRYFLGSRTRMTGLMSYFVTDVAQSGFQGVKAVHSLWCNILRLAFRRDAVTGSSTASANSTPRNSD